MDHKLKRRWCAALRSGNYKQIRGDLSNGIGFCALGVINKILKDDYLSLKTRLCLGPSDIVPRPEYAKIINLNDQEQYSFNEIADWIEENL